MVNSRRSRTSPAVPYMVFGMKMSDENERVAGVSLQLMAKRRKRDDIKENFLLFFWFL